MFRVDDTIVAVATPGGRGGIGVVRVSGPESLAIAAALTTPPITLRPRHATFSRLTAARGAADQAILTYFPAPHSYTGEDVVEISAHGSPVLLRAIVEAAMTRGARMAEPGEFTLRAFLHERMDLVQAEAVRDLIEAVTPLQARAAYDQLEGTLTAEIGRIDRRLFDLTVRLEASLDFPDEGYHFIESGDAAREIAGIVFELDALLGSAAQGRMIREGLHVVLAGRPNAGKSSLFNSLAGAGRAIVTDTPGTTRDLVTETVEVLGVPMTFVDTAGVHSAAVDPVELEGIARAVAVRDVASVIVVVLDRSRPLDADDHALLESTRHRPRVVVANKSDAPAAWNAAALDGADAIETSAIARSGIDRLRSSLVEAASGEPLRDGPAITNVRHADLLSNARAALVRAEAAARENTPEEFVLADLSEARRRLEEVTGARTSDDVLQSIFERFCIGK
jgi:tRNA modification GTPase